MSDDNIKITQWYLVRHAPVINAEKGVYAQADGNAAIPEETIVNALKSSLPEDAIWHVSPLKRTRQTADAISRSLSNLSYDDRLIEQNFGEWQGLSFEEIMRKIKDHPPHNWSLLSAGTTPPNGESFEDVQKRVSDFIDSNVNEQPTRPRILVTHAGVIRAFIGTALGLSNDNALALGVDPFSVSKLTHQTGTGKGGEWQLNSLNQTFGRKK
ncbi:MAG: histidine phosphatase family protein [Kordiimonadaceae bacterium]|jgi:alpha-ribazole phosphatase|nr:histidine phosphatase family protein [Kordiimonadaceae bacterium]MBT6033170.1 histidine phosphatase family protein [Kordiimonadaceae bacterium]